MPSKGGLRLQMLLRWMATLTVFRDKNIRIEDHYAANSGTTPA